MLQEQQQQQHEQEQQKQQHIRSSPDLRRMKGQTPKRKNYYFAHTQIHSLMRSSVKKRNITKNNLQIKRTRNNTQKNNTTATTRESRHCKRHFFIFHTLRSFHLLYVEIGSSAPTTKHFVNRLFSI